MTPQDQAVIRRWAAAGAASPCMVLATGRDPAEEQLALFCDQFKELVPAARILRKSDNLFTAPAIIIGQHQNIAYQAIPGGKQMAPFLEILGGLAGEAGAMTPDIIKQLERLDLPFLLKLYISPHCPHCLLVARHMVRLAAACAPMRLSVIDAELFDARAQHDRVRAVPTLILDDQFRWTGPVEPAEILEIAVGRDPARLSADSLRQLIESGQASHAAGMMIARNQIFPALIDLLTDAKWPVRLGAMVTVEYLVDEARPLAEQLVAPLWERFAHISTPAQGDVAHIFGMIYSESAIGHLRAIAGSDLAEDVREAALEALAEMKPADGGCP
jgi:Thioredoxin domain